jgi:hypothetical protein
MRYHVQLETWRDAGLPQSRTAVENALIMANAPQWALLVDPQVSTAQGKHAYLCMRRVLLA